MAAMGGLLLRPDQLGGVGCDHQFFGAADVGVDARRFGDADHFVDRAAHGPDQRAHARFAAVCQIPLMGPGESAGQPAAIAPRGAVSGEVLFHHQHVQARIGLFQVPGGPQAGISRPDDADVGRRVAVQGRAARRQAAHVGMPERYVADARGIDAHASLVGAGARAGKRRDGGKPNIRGFRGSVPFAAPHSAAQRTGLAMNKNAKAAAVDVDDAADADEAAFAADAEEELRAADAPPQDDLCEEEAEEDDAARAEADAPELSDAEEEAELGDDLPEHDDLSAETALSVDEAPDVAAEDEDLAVEDPDLAAEDEAEPADEDAGLAAEGETELADEEADLAAEDEAELSDEDPDLAAEGEAELADDGPAEAEEEEAAEVAPELEDQADLDADQAPEAPSYDASEAVDAAASESAASDADIWRARAAQLLGAGLASHVITLTGAAAEDENLALEPLLDIVSGALFRLSPGRFAAMLDDPDAAAQAVGADVSLDPIPDLDQTEDDAAAAPAALALVAPLAAAALQAGGPRVVIDADYAICVASRTAEGIARIVAEADANRAEAETAALARIEDRLAQTEAALDAVLAAVTEGGSPVARADAPAADEGLESRIEDRLSARIDASVDRAVAAVRADILKSARARRDADRRSLEPALDRLDAAAAALEEDRRVSSGRRDAYAETIRAIVGELLVRAPGASGGKS